MRKMLALALVLVLPAVALAGQDFPVSKKSNGFNRDPDLAINPNNGDILTVWSNAGQIWISLAKRKGSGRYKKPRARKLSPPGAGSSKPRVTWVEETGEFFVVWERVEQAFSSVTDIVGHAVDAKGQPTGAVVVLRKDGKVNETPVVLSTVDGTRVYHGNGSSAGGRWTVRQLDLAGDYEVEKQKTVAKAKKKVDLLRPADAVGLTGPVAASVDLRLRASRLEAECLALLRTEYQEIDGESRPVAVLTLVRNGEETDSVRFEGYEGISLTIEGHRDRDELPFVHVVLGNVENRSVHLTQVHVRDCRSEGNGAVRQVPSNTGGILRAHVFTPTTRVAIPPAASGKGRGSSDASAYILWSSDGQVWYQAFDETLDLAGNQERVLDHGDTLTFLRGEVVPAGVATGKKPNSVFVWSKSLGNNQQEIRAHAFYLAPVD